MIPSSNELACKQSEGVPASVQVGADPATALRYYYVYNGHGDVVALVEGAGTGSEF